MAPEQFRRMRLYLVDEEELCGGGNEPHQNCELSGTCSELPEEVLELVLVRLPAKAIARLRAVSKSWLRLLCSSEFLERSTALALALRAPAFLLGFNAVGVSGHWWPEADNPSFRHAYKVHDVELDFLPEEFVSGCIFPSLKQYGVVCSASGLLCLVQRPGYPSGGDQSLSICLVNLANKTWDKLPSLEPVSDCHKVMLEVTPPADGELGRCDFQVGVFWMAGSHPILGVCSGNGGSWAIVRVRVPRDLVDGCFMASPAILQGVMSVLFSNPCRGGFENKLVAFDVATGMHVGTWNAPQALPLLMPRRGQGHHLCVHQGKLVWVLQSAARKVDVWMMDFFTQTWIWFSAFPESRFFEPSESFCLRDAQTAGDMLYLAFRVSLLTVWPCDDALEGLYPGGEFDGLFPRGRFRRAVIVGYHIYFNTWHTIAEHFWDVTRNRGRANRIVTGEWRPELYL